MVRALILGEMVNKFMRVSGSMEREVEVGCGKSLSKIINMIFILESGIMVEYKALEFSQLQMDIDMKESLEILKKRVLELRDMKMEILLSVNFEKVDQMEQDSITGLQEAIIKASFLMA